MANSALIVIDVQRTFRDGSWGARNNEFAEDNVQKLLQTFRNRNELVINVHHISANPQSRFYFQSPGFQFQKQALPLSNEIVLEKTVNSAFIGTKLEDILRAQQIKKVFICGLTTPHCVSTTTRMAGNLGFATYLVEDATASFAITDYRGQTYSAQEIQDVSIATLDQEFATIIKTATLAKYL